MGIIAGAAATLRRDDVRFAPALKAAGGSWTLRSALLEAAGCDRRAGPLGYWQWREIHSTLDAARARIAEHAQLPARMDAERWANQAERTLEEVLAALDAVPDSDDVTPPGELQLRPWCDVRAASTCRVPYVPLAALVHGWGPPQQRSWSSMVEHFGLTVGMTSWSLLDRIDPDIRQIPPPPEVAETAAVLRRWMALDDDATAPVEWLFRVTENATGQSLEDLHRQAIEAVTQTSERSDVGTLQGGGA